MTGQRKSLTQRLLEGGVTTGLLLFALVPVYWMVSSSLKSDPELSQIEATWFPHEATLDQYRAALDQTPLLESLLLTGILAVATAVIVVIFGSLAAYAVTQWSFPGKDSFLGVTLFTQLLPQSAVVVPLYLLWNKVGLVGSVGGLTGVYVCLFIPVAVWMLVGFFRSIPVRAHRGRPDRRRQPGQDPVDHHPAGRPPGPGRRRRLHGDHRLG